jgi:hypothetical protein
MPILQKKHQTETDTIASSPVLEIGDRVYYVDRLSYPLTITQVVNDELIKALTDGFKGAEYFAIADLRRID